MATQTKAVIKSGTVSIKYEIIQYEDIDGMPAFDFRTTSDLIQSDVWYPTAAEAEATVRRLAGVG